MFTVILLIASFGFGLITADGHWGYPEAGFPKWGGTCASGLEQSPINIVIGECLKGIYEKFDFDNYDEKHERVTLVNNGHTIQLSDFEHELKLDGGPLLSNYSVEQIHLHWSSEHTINNQRYPLEVHIVHRNRRYPNMTIAAKYRDGITVLAVLFHASAQTNSFIEAVVNNIEAIKSYNNINKPIFMAESLRVRDLFPKFNTYVSYQGSLTTPECSEAVKWIVLLDTAPVTLEQIMKLQQVEYDQDKKLKRNYRAIQPTNDRPVIIAQHSESYTRAAAASSWQFPTVTLVLVLIATNILQ